MLRPLVRAARSEGIQNFFAAAGGLGISLPARRGLILGKNAPTGRPFSYS